MKFVQVFLYSHSKPSALLPYMTCMCSGFLEKIRNKNKKTASQDIHR